MEEAEQCWKSVLATLNPVTAYKAVDSKHLGKVSGRVELSLKEWKSLSYAEREK